MENFFCIFAKFQQSLDLAIDRRGIPKWGPFGTYSSFPFCGESGIQSYPTACIQPTHIPTLPFKSYSDPFDTESLALNPLAMQSQKKTPPDLYSKTDSELFFRVGELNIAQHLLKVSQVAAIVVIIV